jgi:hypothetical protein
VIRGDLGANPHCPDEVTFLFLSRYHDKLLEFAVSEVLDF